MAAGHQKKQIGEVCPICQTGGQGMPFQMIDADKGQLMGIGNRFGGHQADNYAADQAGAACCGDTVQILIGEAGCVEGAENETIQMRQVRAGSNFRHDTAKGCVFVDLGQNFIGQNLCCAVHTTPHNGDRGLVATGLNTHHGKRFHLILFLQPPSRGLTFPVMPFFAVFFGSPARMRGQTPL